jgi:uncharacterized protein YukE
MAGEFMAKPDLVRALGREVSQLSSEMSELVASTQAQIGPAIDACAIEPGDTPQVHAKINDLMQVTMDCANVLDKLADHLGVFGNSAQASDEA